MTLFLGQCMVMLEILVREAAEASRVDFLLKTARVLSLSKISQWLHICKLRVEKLFI